MSVDKRIPPKKSEGWKQYWGDRFTFEALKLNADRWAADADAETGPRKSAMLIVADHLRAAADSFGEYHRKTDYFGFNQ